MKLRTLLLAGLLAAPACSKSNDNVPVMQEDVAAIVKYNKPRLDTFQKRIDDIDQRVRGLPRTLPELADVERARSEARTKLDDLRNKEATLDKMAAGLAKDGKAVELAKLVEDTETMYEENATIIHDDLSSVEGWLSRAEAGQMRAQPAAPVATPVATAAEPAAAEAPATAAAPAAAAHREPAAAAAPKP